MSIEIGEGTDGKDRQQTLRTPAPPFSWQGLLREVPRHPYTAISITVLLIMGIGAIGKHSSEWDEVYVGSARALLRGQNFFDPRVLAQYAPRGASGLGYTYPPFSAWVMIPFTLLPLHLARAIWYGICVFSLVYVIRVAWRLAGGGKVEPLAGAARADRRQQVAFLLGHAVVLQLTLNALTHLQTDLLIAALLIAGISAIARRRFFRAAAWIGIASAFKATPLLFAPYLAWKKQWTAAALVLAVAIGANLLPDTVHHDRGGGTWLAHWFREYFQPMTSSKYVPGDWQNKLDNNQSLAGAANRWLATTHQINGGELRVINRSGNVDPRMIRLAFIGLCLAAMVPAAWAMWKRRRQDSDNAAERPAAEAAQTRAMRENSVDPVILECGMILLLMVLLSPNSSRAHFCVMYLAAFCAARAAVMPRSPAPVRWLLGAALLSSTLSIHLRLPGTAVVEQLMLWIGVVMLAAFFLLLACVATLAVSPDPSPVPAALQTRP